LIDKAVLILTVSEQLFSTLREGPGAQGVFFLKGEAYRQPGALSSPFPPVPGIRESTSLKKI
jgi:hypothetical protein